MLFDEGKITGALARVCNSDGATVGTAFFILPSEGIALTCDHLIPAESESILLDCGDGEPRQGRVATDDRFPAIDLAVIRGIEPPPASALPVVSDYQGISHFWTKGFHYYGTEILDALPTSGRVVGETSTKFSVRGKDYELKNLLLLKTDVIDAGLSGAPVIDPETGVAFGLVNAKFGNSPSIGGFALPFARAEEHSVRLKELFEANAKAVPRFGRFLNSPGALQICRLQRESVIDRLVRRTYFLADKYCDRSEQQIIAEFYESDCLILPLIGNAGVGKTTLLANIARQPEVKAALFILARDLRYDETELCIAINSKLREHVSNLLGPHSDVSVLISSLRSSGEQLTVILDGLNEIPAAAAQSLDGWLDRSITWLEETNTKLIVSSRPEFWQTCANLFPAKRVYPQSDERRLQAGLALGDFSEEEAEIVKELYGLPPAIPISHIQHPLIARMYLELESEHTQAKVIGATRYQVLQRFIRLKCDRIARAVGLGVLSSHVESCLVEAARVTLETGQLELEDSKFFNLFMSNTALADQFVQEGLFMTTSGGKRFSFDEIAEFLQSRTLNFDRILQFFSTPVAEDFQKLTTGAISFAILRFDETGKGELVSQLMSTIVKAHALFAADEANWTTTRIYESVLAQLVQQIQNPDRFTTDIEAYATELSKNPRHNSFTYDRFNFRLAIGRSGLPLRFKINLLRMFMVKEDSYDFEHHHWDDLERYVIRGRRHTGAALAELIQSSPVPVFQALTEWFTDTTRLHENKSTIADAAMAMMFFYRHLAFEPLCELIIRSETQQGNTLFMYMAQHDPLRTVDVCLKWISQEDPLLLKHSAHIATFIAGHVSDNTLEDKLYEILTGVIGRVSDEIDAVATKGIGRLPKYRQSVVDKLINLFMKGSPEVDGYAIAELFDTDFDRVALAIRRSIKSSPEQAGDAISTLSRKALSPPQLDAIIDLIHFGADNGLLRFHTFGLGMEYLLSKSKNVSDPTRVMDLVRHVIGIDPSIRLHLRYFACGSHREDLTERKLQDEILELLIATQTGGDNEKVLRHLVESDRYQPEDLKTFLTIERTMPPERFHRTLLGAAFLEDGFANTLVDWLQMEGGISPFGPTQILLDRVQNGESGSEAVQNIFNERLDS